MPKGHMARSKQSPHEEGAFICRSGTHQGASTSARAATVVNSEAATLEAPAAISNRRRADVGQMLADIW